jgi:hypothetical protein
MLVHFSAFTYYLSRIKFKYSVFQKSLYQEEKRNSALFEM